MNRRIGPSILLLGTALLASAAERCPPVGLGADLAVAELSPGFWLITSVSELAGFGRVASNAMLVVAPRGSVLIDIPATELQARAVLDWADQTLSRPVQAVVCTHAHADRLGGLGAAHERGIASFSLPLTQTLAAAAGLPRPRLPLKEDQGLSLGGIELQVLFPGAGHAPDNLVVWVPSGQVLFGGCLIKEAASQSMGSRADLAAWGGALVRVQARFPAATIVVPGHGRPGGSELLAHTRRLVAGPSREGTHGEAH